MKMKVTVFTPTYNRAKLIHRVFDSLQNQNSRDFEWLIIDDGSSDNTEEVVSEFSKKSKFPIQYIKRENKGKAASINDGLLHANGEFFLVFDSDDWCVDNAIERFISAWDDLSQEQKKSYCAVSALKAYQDGSVVGDDYSRMESHGLSYIDRFNRRVAGDKWEFIRTDIHKSFPYELFPGEKYQAPEFAWLKMGVRYKTIFLNEVLSVVEYQEDGISRNNIKHRAASPNSTAKFYLTGLSASKTIYMKARMRSNAGRFYLHAGQFFKAIKESGVLFPIGFFAYFMDKMKA